MTGVNRIIPFASVDQVGRPLALVIFNNRKWEYVLHEDM